MLSSSQLDVKLFFALGSQSTLGVTSRGTQVWTRGVEAKIGGWLCFRAWLGQLGRLRCRCAVLSRVGPLRGFRVWLGRRARAHGSKRRR